MYPLIDLRSKYQTRSVLRMLLLLSALVVFVDVGSYWRLSCAAELLRDGLISDYCLRSVHS